MSQSSSRLFGISIKKTHSIWLGASLIVIGVIGTMVALWALYRPQNIDPRATGCSEAPVNVEFRKYTGKDEPGWKDGVKFKNIKVGDKIDVNCFAKNGSALLSGGSFTATLDGKSITDFKKYLKSATEVRGYLLSKPGKYTFKCQNSSGCSDSDTLTVTGKAAASPSPTPSASPQVSPTPSPLAGTCANPSISDLNRDCQSNIVDYDIFLADFRAHYAAP